MFDGQTVRCQMMAACFDPAEEELIEINGGISRGWDDFNGL